MEDYGHIHYLQCPHFTIGRVDQWGEHGYLLFEGRVFRYEEDRKEQCGSTFSPMSVKDFLRFAEQQQLVIPKGFMAKLLENKT